MDFVDESTNKQVGHARHRPSCAHCASQLLARTSCSVLHSRAPRLGVETPESIGVEDENHGQRFPGIFQSGWTDC